MMSLLSRGRMTVSCIRNRDMTFRSSHVTHNALMFLILLENRVAVNRKTFPVAKKEICVPDYHRKNLKCKCKPGYTGTPCGKFFNSKDNIKYVVAFCAAETILRLQSDTRSVCMCCEIIISNVTSHDLVRNKCFSIKNNIYYTCSRVSFFLSVY